MGPMSEAGQSETETESGLVNFMESIPLTEGKGIFRGRRGDPSIAPRCLAKTRSGGLCQRAAEANPKTGLRKRCRLHGGLSTGPRTPEGLASIVAAKLRHGKYSRATKAAKRALGEKLRLLKSETRGKK